MRGIVLTILFFLFLIFFSIVLAAALVNSLDGDSERKEQPINVADEDTTVYIQSFSIFCDLEKEMGLAVVATYKNPQDNFSESSVGGMLTDEQYEKWCGKVSDNAR